MFPTDLDGRWPQEGADVIAIKEILKHHNTGNLCWGLDTILGVPSMRPDQLGMEIYAEYAGVHANALLTHTRGPGEKGFSGVQKIERDLIQMTGHLLGADNVDGYVTSGGTEGNIMGLWIGRQWLRNRIDTNGDTRVAVMASPASHYSLRKGCALLDLGEGRWQGEGRNRHFVPSKDGNGLHLVRSGCDGSIDIEALEWEIRRLRVDLDIRRFIIFLNAGTTLTGSSDDAVAVGLLTDSLRQEFQGCVEFYIHVDAAYGGMIIPFLDPSGTWIFRVPQVSSAVVDPYKMGLAPMAQGIFLARKSGEDRLSRDGLQRFIERPTGYVNEAFDDTLIGSRNGAMALSCWAIFRQQGFAGFRQLHERSQAKARSLHESLSRIKGMELLPQHLNMVAFLLPESWSDELCHEFDVEIVHPQHMMSDWFSTNPTNLDVTARKLVKFNITRDVQDFWIKPAVRQIADFYATNIA